MTYIGIPFFYYFNTPENSNSLTYVDMLQIAASLATIAGVMWAVWTFKKQVDYKRIDFSRQEITAYLSCVSPSTISKILSCLKDDSELAEEKFIEIFWSENRAFVREALTAADHLYAMVKTGEVGTKIAGNRNSFKHIYELNNKTKFYRQKAADVYNDTDFETEFDTIQIKLASWSKKYDRTPIILNDE